jgi:hypothetical protein
VAAGILAGSIVADVCVVIIALLALIYGDILPLAPGDLLLGR